MRQSSSVALLAAGSFVAWLWVAVLAGCETPPLRFEGPSNAPEVVVSQGRLVGSVEDGVRRYLGIPYAGAPTGHDRFRRAPAAASWEGVHEATAYAPICPQLRYDAGRSEFHGNEDCLHLNVWAPDEQGDPRPVMVWIHGGGRVQGDGRRDPAAFVKDTGVIVVGIQYRLDALAFLAHPALTSEDPTRLASGNYGFMDAIDALFWVQREIERFGGDPDRVTIAGLSGGGTMVCGLMVAPEAAGLFHGAIVQSSGGCWFPTDPIQLSEERGRQMSRALGCEEAENVPACLRALPVEAFFGVGGALAFIELPFEMGTTEWFASRPITGGSSGHLIDGSVFPRAWPDAFRSGAFHRVPLMISITEHEGRRVYAELLSTIGAQPLGADDYLRALHGLSGSTQIAERAADAFPLDASAGSPAEAFADVATAAHYSCPHAEMARAVAGYTPTWLAEFRVRGPRVNPRVELGAYHGADTELLFGYGNRGPLPPQDDAQTRAAKRLRAYVANFMRTGDPNGTGLPAWPRHLASKGARHLAFSTAPYAAAGLRESACRFWRSVDWDMLPDP